MVTEAEARPLSIRDASRAVDEALEAVGRQAKAYRRLRAGLDQRATAKAHADYGFATLEFAGACVTLAEVADRVDPVWAAAREKSQPVPTAAGPEYDAAWHAYQEARRSGSREAIDAARGRWRDALLDWHLQVHKHHGAEDQSHARGLSRRLDESTRLDPGHPFRPKPSRRDAVVSESRERERQDSIRRANAGLGNPWVRSSRSRGQRSGR